MQYQHKDPGGLFSFSGIFRSSTEEIRATGTWFSSKANGSWFFSTDEEGNFIFRAGNFIRAEQGQLDLQIATQWVQARMADMIAESS